MADTNAQLQLIEALLALQRELPTIPKAHTADTGAFKYKYADLTDILFALRDPLANNGLALIQTFEVEEGLALLVTTLYHVGGGHLSSRCPVALHGYKNPQDAGKAITYFRRYSIMALLCLATEDDDAQGVAQAPRAQAPAKDRRPAFSKATQIQIDRLTALKGDATAKELLEGFGGGLDAVPEKDFELVYHAFKSAADQEEDRQIDTALDKE